MTDQWEPPELRRIVDSIEYMPGWLAYLGRANEGGGQEPQALTLHIVSETPDSYQTSRTMRVNHSFLVPLATYNERTWKAWLFDRFVDVWRHETGEFLKFSGTREFAPHHGNGEDPYRTWHVGDLADTRVRAGEARG